MTDIIKQDQVQIIERVLISGDLSKLSAAERVSYYNQVCLSMGLNPLTKPFDYITLNGKLTLYAKRDATDQLRSIRGVSIVIVARERHDDVYVVTARATLQDGRTDESIGAVSVGGLKGDALANALMKAETKAKRRVTLSIVGLGWLDETEIETISGAQTPSERDILVAQLRDVYRDFRAAGGQMALDKATVDAMSEQEIQQRIEEMRALMA